jgi:hypothetical protein
MLPNMTALITALVASNAEILAKDLNRVMGYLFAILYVFTVQGRIGAIQALTLAEGKTLADPNSNDVVLSKSFKTARTLGVQVIQHNLCHYMHFEKVDCVYNYTTRRLDL